MNQARAKSNASTSAMRSLPVIAISSRSMPSATPAQAGNPDCIAASRRSSIGGTAAPRWLRDLGRTSWLLVGFFVLMAGVVWLLGATYTIVGPVVAGTIVATVSMPIVGVLQRHMPRAAAAGLVLLGLAAVAAFVLVIVIGGITSQKGAISENASAGADKAAGWLEDVGSTTPAPRA